MRIRSSVTSLSWIPSEAITGPNRLPMDLGIGHYDDPPPDRITDATLDELQAADGLRAANRLAAWIEVENGRIVDAGYDGRAVVGSTTAKLGPLKITYPGVAFPVLRDDPAISGGTARFVQSVGARTGAPLPHRIDRPPYVKITGPTTWVTLALEISIDGTARHEVVGASPFPRHWLFDAEGTLVEKSGLVDWADWTRHVDHARSPWHGVEHEAVIAQVESEVERSLSVVLMDLHPKIRKVQEGDTLIRQGEAGDTVYLVLDGLFDVDIDGEVVAELGPGAIVGEMAALADGVRTATVQATTPAKVAAVAAASLDTVSLSAVATERHRDDQTEED